MPYIYTKTDHKPLCYETELIVDDIKMLAQHVGLLLLGKHRHVSAILSAKNRSISPSTSTMIDRSIRQLTVKTEEQRWKRDGWLFQMMTWISIRFEQPNVNLFSQPPHTNPAQHGIDGLAVILTTENKIKAIIIAEDKYTENPRKTIKEQVWPEFNSFELGEFDSHLVTQITALLSHLSDDEVDDIIENDIYKTSNRIYRAGITPLASRFSAEHKMKLFKGYSDCVPGIDQLRRQTLTFSQLNIRNWMDTFSDEIIKFLETQRS
jgi:hypothetical protein